MRAVRDERGNATLRVLGFAGLALLLLAILVPIVALTFSVQVQGNSMKPTLTQGDRLLFDFVDRKEIRRFDLVAAQPGGGANVVKRVIGLPGDTISVEVGDDGPMVYVQPAGSTTRYRVDNPTWPAQVSDKVQPCCAPDGKLSGRRRPVVVPDGQYWLIGDNWGGSDDSRVFGFVTSDDIKGRLDFRLLPSGEFGTVPTGAELVAVS